MLCWYLPIFQSKQDGQPFDFNPPCRVIFLRSPTIHNALRLNVNMFNNVYSTDLRWRMPILLNPIKHYQISLKLMSHRQQPLVLARIHILAHYFWPMTYCMCWTYGISSISLCDKAHNCTICYEVMNCPH
jgi:hypothetical protein